MNIIKAMFYTAIIIIMALLITFIVAFALPLIIMFVIFIAVYAVITDHKRAG